MIKIKTKTILSVFLAIVLLFVCLLLAACGEAQDENANLDFENKRVLVTYFSATGNTERVETFIQEATSSDILEITPKEPYSSADLNWDDPNSRVFRTRAG